MRCFLRFLIFIIAVATIGMRSHAQKPDTIVRRNFVITVKDTTTDSAEDFASYKGYFYPTVALKFSKQLSLTQMQISKLKAIDAIFQLKKTETGISTKRNEHMLDSLFRTDRVNEGVIIFYTNRYGLYEGEYRGAVLIACYNTRKVLTPQQTNKLISLENHN